MWQELYDARKGLREDAHVEPTSFRCSILGGGGAWTKANRGLSYDVYQGRSQGAEVENWCRRAGLTMSSRYSVATYGDRVAAALARGWCHKMEWLMARTQAGPGERLAVSEEDLRDYHEPECLPEALQGTDARAQAQLADLRGLRPSSAASSGS